VNLLLFLLANDESFSVDVLGGRGIPAHQNKDDIYFVSLLFNATK